jgi:putative addiction module component (TIGR02574 family)
MTIEQIRDEALELPPDERARLADILLQSLPGDLQAEDAWREEIAQRCREIDNGTAGLVPAR